MSELFPHDQTRVVIAELAELLPKVLGARASLSGLGPALGDEEVVRAKWDPVFTGGSILSLLITDPAAPAPSRTKDIDLILEIGNYWEYVGLEGPLQKAGFVKNDPPMVAWKWKGVRIDFLPDRSIEPLREEPNRWFPYLMREAERFEVLPDRWAWRASAPCFLATKFEAFDSRGGGDYLLSKDIEDILAVVDGRVELIEELRRCHRDVREFVSRACADLLGEPRFLEALPKQIPDEDREEITAARLRVIATGT